MSGIGAMVAELRARRGWTQEALAQRVGVSAQAVSKWETDQSMPDVTLLLPLASALGCTTDELLNGDPARLTHARGAVVTGEVVPEHRRATKILIRVEYDGDEKPVLVRVPIGVLRFGVRLWSSLPILDDHPEIDKNVLLEHIERGLVGEVIRVESQDGAVVTVALEE